MGSKDKKMKINFKCKTSHQDAYINTLVISLRSGSKITIDRGLTISEVDDKGEMTMTWEDCYLWALDGFHFFGNEEEYGLQLFDLELNEFRKLIKGCNAEFVIEDEAPSDYNCEIISYEIV